MPVQLIITGDHTTDVLAEIQNLSDAMNGPVEHRVSVELPSAGETTEEPGPETAPEVKVEKLNRKEQDAAVAAMIEAGEIDQEKYDLLTKGRQNTVNDGIKENTSSEASLDDMFDDDDPTVTADTIRDLMGKVGKDAEGNPIQNNLLKIREILTTYVPKGEEVKVGKIPQDKFVEVYGKLKAMEAESAEAGE
jgi:hypothetical protein